MSLWDLIAGLFGNSDSSKPTIANPVPTPPKEALRPQNTGWLHAVTPLFDLLGHTEGTDRGAGYNESLAYGAYTGGPRNLVAMTLAQIDTLQTQMLNHPKNKWNSSALGRYQIVRTTLRKLREGMDLKTLFNAQLQDRFALKLLVGRGLVRWLEGNMTTSFFIDQLAKEWASIPNSKGNGHYSGQRVGTSVATLVDTLGLVASRATPAVIAEIKRVTT